MTSVVIAAHNEAAVLGRCLDALLTDAGATIGPDGSAGPLDITVVANGCTDTTAAVAGARRGVRVVNLPEAGKPAALNAGDAAAEGFPRIYLDADIVLTRRDIAALAAALGPEAGDPGALAAVPRRGLALARRPLLVRAYYTINARLPAYRGGIFGRGAIALSAAARARFDEFPEQIADDLFLDSLFTAAEKREVWSVTSVVETPYRTRDLVRRLARLRRGNAAMRAMHGSVRRAARTSWLRDVVLRRPWLAPAAICYVGITMLAAVRARREQAWQRDESTRQVNTTQA